MVFEGGRAVKLLQPIKAATPENIQQSFPLPFCRNPKRSATERQRAGPL
jgi:hypothetical protein